MTSERKALSSVELYNVICSIYDMEIQQYMIRLTLKGLDDKINLLSKPQYRSKPKFSYPSAINIMLTIIIMAVCAVIGFIYGTFSDFAGGDENLLLNILIPIPGLICAIMAALAGCVLAIPANIVCVVITIPKAKKAYQKNLERYEINVVEQEKENKKILAQKEILLRERKDLCSRYEKADDELRQLYLKSVLMRAFATLCQ